MADFIGQSAIETEVSTSCSFSLRRDYSIMTFCFHPKAHCSAGKKPLLLQTEDGMKGCREDAVNSEEDLRNPILLANSNWLCASHGFLQLLEL